MNDPLPSRVESTARLHDWLKEAVRREASDLHLVCHYRPTQRIHGYLCAIDERMIEAGEVASTLEASIPDRIRAQYESNRNADFAMELEIDGTARRFRVNLFCSSGQMAACFRVLSAQVPELEWAGLPEELADRLIHLRNGLVLIAGVTGAGKTTTLAMLIRMLNEEGGYRIITVEDPIEYRFVANERSLITQREVGDDVLSFADGLKYGLRQDPDVILVGEIRDRQTAQMALSAAETGHLVFSTLHTRDAKGAISRYIDLFPQDVQGEIRSQLSMSLRAVVSQHLLPSARAGEKRHLALEVMINNTPMASAIRLGRIETIETNLQTGRADGMITLDESIRRLLSAGKISHETADRYLSDRRS